MKRHRAVTQHMHGQARNAIICVLLAILITACATPVSPRQGVMPDTLAFIDSYRIGPADTLRIDVWRNPEVSATVPVRPDGKISTPLVEDMVAADKTPSELARDIEKILSAFIKNPTVTVIIQNFGSINKQHIRVIGEANTAQSIAYKQGLTLLDVMIAAGGLTDYAAGNRAKIVRNVNGNQSEFRVRLDDLLKKADVSANIDMFPGDILIIPESLF